MYNDANQFCGVLRFFKRDGTEGRVYELLINSECSIGYDVNSTIRLKQPTNLKAKSSQCFIEVDADGVAKIRNSATDNPVTMNNQMLNKSKYLVDGDTFTVFGKQLRYENPEMTKEDIVRLTEKNAAMGVETPSKVFGSAYWRNKRRTISTVGLRQSLKRKRSHSLLNSDSDMSSDNSSLHRFKSMKGSKTPHLQKRTQLIKMRPDVAQISTPIDSKTIKTLKTPIRKRNSRSSLMSCSTFLSVEHTSPIMPSKSNISPVSEINMERIQTPMSKFQKRILKTPSSMRINRNITRVLSGRSVDSKLKYFTRSSSSRSKSSAFESEESQHSIYVSSFSRNDSSLFDINTPKNNTSTVIIDTPYEFKDDGKRKSKFRKSIHEITSTSFGLVETPDRKTPKSTLKQQNAMSLKKNSPNKKTPTSALKNRINFFNYENISDAESIKSPVSTPAPKSPKPRRSHRHVSPEDETPKGLSPITIAKSSTTKRSFRHLNSSEPSTSIESMSSFMLYGTHYTSGNESGDALTSSGNNEGGHRSFLRNISTLSDEYLEEFEKDAHIEANYSNILTASPKANVPEIKALTEPRKMLARSIRRSLPTDQISNQENVPRSDSSNENDSSILETTHSSSFDYKNFSDRKSTLDSQSDFYDVSNESLENTGNLSDLTESSDDNYPSSTSIKQTEISKSHRRSRTSKFRQSPKNDLTNIAGLRRLMSTPKDIKSPKNDLRNIAGLRRLLSTPKDIKSPKNDLRIIPSIRQLMSSPKVRKSPKNDLRDIPGFRQLMTTLREAKSPKNDLTNIWGVRQLMSTPKNMNSPKNDLRNIIGVKKLMATPKEMKSPNNDLTDVSGVKKLYEKSHKNDLTDVRGVKQLMVIPKGIRSPHLRGLKNILGTPKEMHSPLNDLRNVQGIKKLMTTPKPQNSPCNELDDLRGVKHLLQTPKDINNLTNFSGIESLMASPQVSAGTKSRVLTRSSKSAEVVETIDENPTLDISGICPITDDNTDGRNKLFDSLIEKKPLRTYKGKSTSPQISKSATDRRSEGATTTVYGPDVEKWIKEQCNFSKIKDDSEIPLKIANAVRKSIKKKSKSNLLVPESFSDDVNSSLKLYSKERTPKVKNQSSIKKAKNLSHSKLSHLSGTNKNTDGTEDDMISDLNNESVESLVTDDISTPYITTRNNSVSTRNSAKINESSTSTNLSENTECTPVKLPGITETTQNTSLKKGSIKKAKKNSSSNVDTNVSDTCESITGESLQTGSTDTFNVSSQSTSFKKGSTRNSRSHSYLDKNESESLQTSPTEIFNISSQSSSSKKGSIRKRQSHSYLDKNESHSLQSGPTETFNVSSQSVSSKNGSTRKRRSHGYLDIGDSLQTSPTDIFNISSQSSSSKKGSIRKRRSHSHLDKNETESLQIGPTEIFDISSRSTSSKKDSTRKRRSHSYLDKHESESLQISPTEIFNVSSQSTSSKKGSTRDKRPHSYLDKNENDSPEIIVNNSKSTEPQKSDRSPPNVTSSRKTSLKKNDLSQSKLVNKSDANETKVESDVKSIDVVQTRRNRTAKNKMLANLDSSENKTQKVTRSRRNKKWENDESQEIMRPNTRKKNAELIEEDSGKVIHDVENKRTTRKQKNITQQTEVTTESVKANKSDSLEHDIDSRKADANINQTQSETDSSSKSMKSGNKNKSKPGNKAIKTKSTRSRNSHLEEYIPEQNIDQTEQPEQPDEVRFTRSTRRRNIDLSEGPAEIETQVKVTTQSKHKADESDIKSTRSNRRGNIHLIEVPSTMEPQIKEVPKRLNRKGKQVVDDAHEETDAMPKKSNRTRKAELQVKDDSHGETGSRGSSRTRNAKLSEDRVEVEAEMKESSAQSKRKGRLRKNDDAIPEVSDVKSTRSKVKVKKTVDEENKSDMQEENSKLRTTKSKATETKNEDVSFEENAGNKKKSVRSTRTRKEGNDTGTNIKENNEQDIYTETTKTSTRGKRRVMNVPEKQLEPAVEIDKISVHKEESPKLTRSRRGVVKDKLEENNIIDMPKKRIQKLKGAKTKTVNELDHKSESESELNERQISKLKKTVQFNVQTEVRKSNRTPQKSRRISSEDFELDFKGRKKTATVETASGEEKTKRETRKRKTKAEMEQTSSNENLSQVRKSRRRK